MERELIKSDMVKIKRSGYLELFSFIFVEDYIEVTTSNYHDYIVESYMNQVKGLNFKYKVVEMLYEYDAEEDDKSKELWDQDGRSYREWKVVVKV